MKNIRPKKASKFYGDDTSEVQESKDQEIMEDKFYKEAAREILRDAVRERGEKEDLATAPPAQTQEAPLPPVVQQPPLSLSSQLQ